MKQELLEMVQVTVPIFDKREYLESHIFFASFTYVIPTRIQIKYSEIEKLG